MEEGGERWSFKKHMKTSSETRGRQIGATRGGIGLTRRTKDKILRTGEFAKVAVEPFRRGKEP